VTATPWGRAEDLRARRLRPGPGASREEVDRNQRERLFGAMVIAVAENGYEKTRVADLLRISGVSRNTFYRQFKNKEDCFLATVDAIVAVGGEFVVTAFRESEGDWGDRLATGLTALFELIAEHPPAARLYYVETYAAGGEALDKVERMGDRIEELAVVAMEQSPQHHGMPRDLLRAILRGFRRVIQTRLRNGGERDLIDEGPELLRWALGYRTPPTKLRRPRKPTPLGYVPRVDPHDKSERILDAVMELMATKGYNALTIADIAQHAAISLTTFYACFESKDAAVVAALRRGADRILEATAPAYLDAPDWPRGVGAGIHAVFAYLMLERPFAQFGGVEVHSGSPLVVAVRDQLMMGAQAFLADGYKAHPHVKPIVGEAISASIDAMLFDQVGRRDRARLYELAPTATYLALVPFVGIDEACAIANSSR
jgi:TetR/AcrR family transcriptional regulator